VSEAIIFTTLMNSSPTVAQDMLAQAKQSIFLEHPSKINASNVWAFK